MKRSPMPPRKKPLRSKPKRTSLMEKIERDLWRDGLGRCAMNGLTVCEGKVRGHHTVTQQVLRRKGLRLALWDKRNRLALCDRHHRRHHSKHEPIPRDRLPACVFEFAAEHDLEMYLERVYPE